MKVITVINQKGGVGKSTTANALAAGLATKKRVLAVDLDGQGNLTFISGATSTGGAAAILQDPSRTASEIIKADEYDLIPSGDALTAADIVITGARKQYHLHEALHTIKGNYDYCIVDTPPALGILTVNALTAANGIIIPAAADILSMQGVSQLTQTITTLKTGSNSALNIYGILLTRHNPRTILTRDMSDIFAGIAKELDTKLFKATIREATAIKEAQAMRQSIFKYAPKSKVAADYRAFVKEVKKELDKR